MKNSAAMIVFFFLALTANSLHAQEVAEGYWKMGPVRRYTPKLHEPESHMVVLPSFGGVPIILKITWNAEFTTEGTVYAMISGTALNHPNFSTLYHPSIHGDTFRIYRWITATGSKAYTPISLTGSGTQSGHTTVTNSYLVGPSSDIYSRTWLQAFRREWGPINEQMIPDKTVLPPTPYTPQYDYVPTVNDIFERNGIDCVAVYMRGFAECMLNLSWLDPVEVEVNPSPMTEGLSIGHITVDMRAEVSGHDSSNVLPPVE